MLAQLIQALYNIVDSLFVGRYADSGAYRPFDYLSHPAIDDRTGCGNRRRHQYGYGVPIRRGSKRRSKGICRRGHSFGDCFVVCVRPCLLDFYAHLREAVHILPRGNFRRRDLRQNCLRFQLGFVFGKRLDKNITGKRRYENPYVRANIRRGHQHSFGSPADFRMVRATGNGNRRRRRGYRRRTDGSGLCRNEKRLLSLSADPSLRKTHNGNFPVGSA